MERRAMTKFYADNGVDAFIAPLLPAKGYAADIGANNGVLSSNTKHFEDEGWTVLCVEPNPALAAEGRGNRKLWRVVACDAREGEGLFSIVGKYPYASCSGFHVDNIPASLGVSQLVLKREAIHVPLRRLDGLLKEAGFPRLDLLSIDTEGHELAVMEGLDLSVWKPTVIVAEGWPGKFESDLKTYLGAREYTFLATRQHDHIFKRATP